MECLKKNLKFVVASCSFKGSLSAAQASSIMARSIKNALASKFELDVIEVPIADGGEGTVDCFLQALKGERAYVRVLNPLQKEIEAYYGILPDNVAIIEMAAASGLYLINSNELNPLKTTTFGTGQLIKSALDRGCKKIIIGLGGSATNDSGHGMAKALGAKFLDFDGKEVEEVGGGTLDRIAKIDLSSFDARVKDCEFIAASDVQNPLCGKRGATYVFGPQKGVTEDMKEDLDSKLLHFGKLLEKTFDKTIIEKSGAGAAGGLGAGVLSFLDAKIYSGIELLKEIIRFDEKILDADYIFTGEGQIDDSTLDGKALLGVLESAKKQNIPVIGFAGKLPLDEQGLYDAGFQSLFSISNGPIPLEYAMQNAEKLLENAVHRVCRLIK